MLATICLCTNAATLSAGLPGRMNHMKVPVGNQDIVLMNSVHIYLHFIMRISIVLRYVSGLNKFFLF